MLQTATTSNYKSLPARSVKPRSVLKSSDTIGWQNVRAIHFRHTAREAMFPASDDHCLVLNLGMPASVSVISRKGKVEGRIGSGEVAIIPPGSSWISRSESAESPSMLLLYLRPLFVRSAVQEVDFGGGIGLTPQIGFRDKHICHVAMSLLHELNDANVVGRLYADTLATGLAIQLVRRYSSLKDVHVGHGGMAPHKLRRAIALIDHHLSDEEEGRVALRTVARDVHMSYFHFSRAFKQSMGMTATNYIAERRIERAKKLLEETELPISEIALRSGFSSQSHFTTAFRRLAGATPKAFRAAL